MKFNLTRINLLACLITVLFSAEVNAQGSDVRIRTDKKSGKTISITNTSVAKVSGRSYSPKSKAKVKTLAARSVKKKEDVAAVESSDAFINDYKEAFKLASISSDLTLKGATRDNLGMTHVRYAQTYNGVTVKGAELISHLNAAGEVTSVNGRTLENLNVETKPRIGSKGAVKKAMRTIKTLPAYKTLKRKLTRQARVQCAKTADVSKCLKKKEKKFEEVYSIEVSGKPTLQIHNEGFLNNSKETESYLAWEFTLLNKTGDGETFVVDALSGAIVKRTLAGEALIHRTIYDCSDPLGDLACYLNLEWAYPWGLYTFGRSENQPIRGPNPQAGPFQGMTETDDLYDFAGGLHDYWQNKFNRDGGNGKGGTGNGTDIPFTETRFVAYADAGSNGHFCETLGAWVAGNTGIRVCVGNIVNDLLGHEYAHSLARNISTNENGSINALAMVGEAGALNESLADIYGEAFEFHKTGALDWKLGTDAPLGIYRDMGNPPSVTYKTQNPPANIPSPDRYNDPNFYCGQEDTGGIHHNSTVPSKAAFLASEGGEFNGCQINGIGIEKVEQIWYRAITSHFTTTETFNMAYNSIIQACQELAEASSLPGNNLPVEITSSDCDNVTKALQSVEMNQAGLCSGPNADRPLIPDCAGSCYLSPFAQI